MTVGIALAGVSMLGSCPFFGLNKHTLKVRGRTRIFLLRVLLVLRSKNVFLFFTVSSVSSTSPCEGRGVTYCFFIVVKMDGVRTFVLLT